MVKDKFKGRKVDYKKRRVSKRVIPNQSMTMKEVIERFVKGLPMDIKEKPKIYMEQSGYDFEKMSGLEPTEKAYQATEFKADAEQLTEEVKANDKAKHERKRKADIDEALAKAGQAQTQKPDPQGAGKA